MIADGSKEERALTLWCLLRLVAFGQPHLGEEMRLVRKVIWMERELSKWAA